MSVESTKRNGKLDFEINVNGFQLVSDVSEKNGGSALGPNPHDLLEAALAACTAITMQMYAHRKGYALKSSDVKIKITKEGAENEMSREIVLDGDLTPEQRTAILAIAEKCPIHLFLERGARIVTSGK